MLTAFLLAWNHQILLYLVLLSKYAVDSVTFTVVLSSSKSLISEISASVSVTRILSFIGVDVTGPEFLSDSGPGLLS